MEASIIDTRPGLVIVLLAGGLINPLAGMLIGGLVSGMVGIGADVLTEVCMIVVVVVVITLEDVAPVLYAGL